MFLLQAPQVRDLEPFTTMPDALRRPQRSDWADANRGGAVTDSFLEGPVFDAAGHLYVADIPWGRVFRIDPQGAWTLVAEYDGEPNGMKFLDARTLLITDYKNGLMRLDVATGRISAHLLRRNSERFKGVNDLVFDAEGNLYFTDQGQSGLHDPRWGSSSPPTAPAVPMAWPWMTRAGCWSPTRAWAWCGCSTTAPSLCWCCAASPAARSPTWPLAARTAARCM
jgi:streptogramin lyase